MEENKLDSNFSSCSEVNEFFEFHEFLIYLYCFSYVLLNFSSYDFELLAYFYQELVISIVFLSYLSHFILVILNFLNLSIVHCNLSSFLLLHMKVLYLTFSYFIFSYSLFCNS